ncbi:hypothetical protein BJY00DRAFT_320044 [Aspergillus carlsbadensis]|nr:hypothetical protein BJY00DRAFT_320044 [Aspergillus carlsbadensis]
MPTVTPLSSCTPTLQEVPTTAAACSISTHISSSSSSPVRTLQVVEGCCCGTADAVAYSDGAYSCITQSQTVGDVADCLLKGSRPGSDFGAKAGIGQILGNAHADADASPTSGGSIPSRAIAVATDASTEPSTTPMAKRAKLECEPSGTKTGLKIGVNGGEAQGHSASFSVTTAILLALMVFGGAVRPVP